jgi:hypothetical protein
MSKFLHGPPKFSRGPSVGDRCPSRYTTRKCVLKCVSQVCQALHCNVLIRILTLIFHLYDYVYYSMAYLSSTSYCSRPIIDMCYALHCVD